jgi:hypothetical protein
LQFPFDTQNPSVSLQWLAGGQWQDIKKSMASAKATFIILVCCPTLEIWLTDSSNVEGLPCLALQFEATASSPVLRECVGALDSLTVFL